MILVLGMYVKLMKTMVTKKIKGVEIQKKIYKQRQSKAPDVKYIIENGLKIGFERGE